MGPTYHAVYESGGSIWYLRNRRNAGWELERLLSNGATGATDPSISTHSWVHEDQIQVYVTWRESDNIVFMASNVDNGVTWRPPVVFPFAYGAQGPILSDASSLIWADGGSILYYKLPLENDSWWPHTVPGTEGNVSLPAVSVSACCPLVRQVAFIRDGRIFVGAFRDPDIFNYYAPPVLTESPVDLTTPGWVATNPTLVNAGTDPYVAWEESNGPLRRIAFRQRSAGTWSSTTSFTHSTHMPTKPVLGFDSCSRLNLVWQCGDHVALCSRPISGGAWTPVADAGPGRAPSITASNSSAAKTGAMWIRGTTAPYAIEISNTGVSPEASTDLRPTAIGQTGVGLAWTAAGAGTGTTVEYDLRYSLSSITEANWASHPRAAGVPTPGAPGSAQEHSITGLEMCTQYQFALKSRSACGDWSPISNVLHVTTSCGGGGGGGPGEIEPANVPPPAAIELITSNPLRGPGTIRYGIPAVRAGEPIELGIFDLSGRRVKTLTQGTANPGRFEVGWDVRSDGGNKVGPGLYFLRLRVGNEVLRRTVVVIQ